jgi:hypothetical protein
MRPAYPAAVCVGLLLAVGKMALVVGLGCGGDALPRRIPRGCLDGWLFWALLIAVRPSGGAGSPVGRSGSLRGGPRTRDIAAEWHWHGRCQSPMLPREER